MTEQPLPVLHDATGARPETAFYGLMAYRELTAFERLSSDARFSPTLADREALARLAVQEFGHYELVRERLLAQGADPATAMEPFQGAIDSLHGRTKPGDWYESLMNAYVIDTVAEDFYLAMAQALDTEARALVSRIHATGTQTEWIRERLRSALADDPRLASRLALWGRRLLGEALTHARRIGDDHGFWDNLLSLPTEGERGEKKARLFARLVENHSRRMSALGLTA